MAAGIKRKAMTRNLKKKSPSGVLQKYLNSKQGFTLIEILMALGIFAGSVAMLMGSVTSAMTVQSRNEERIQAVWLANNKMVEVQNEIEEEIEKKKFPDNKSKSGEFKEPYEKYSWEYNIRKVEIPFSGDIGGEQGQNPVLRGVIQSIVKDISQSVREVKVKVVWEDDELEEQKEVVLTTHVVNLSK